MKANCYIYKLCTKNLKQELLKAIDNETVDINLMYRFYEAIK